MAWSHKHLVRGLLFSIFIFVILGMASLLALPKEAKALALCSEVDAPSVDVDVDGYGSFSTNGSNNSTITVDPGTVLSFYVYTRTEPGTTNDIRYPSNRYQAYPGPAGNISPPRHYITDPINQPDAIYVNIYGDNCEPDSVDWTQTNTMFKLNIVFPAVPPTCDIRVTSNVSTTWSLSGPNNLNGSGTDTTYTSQPTGSYSINAPGLSGYSGPSVNGNPQNCTDGNTTTFTLTYTQNPTPPPTCQDGGAYNFGQPLPCTYQCWDGSIVTDLNNCPAPPPQKCQDTSAYNYGQPLPCTYQCWDGSIVTDLNNCPPHPNNPPLGYVDVPSVDYDASACSILGGWAFDPDTPSTSINYEVDSDGSYLTSGVANGSRPDVNAAFGITGNHGWGLFTPASLLNGYPHQLRFYEFDTTDNSKHEMTNSPHNIRCGTPPPESCTVTANPNSGSFPLNNVNVTVSVGGFEGSAHEFDVDCTNNGSYEGTMYQTVGSWTFNNICNYSGPATLRGHIRNLATQVVSDCTTTITSKPNTPTLSETDPNYCNSGPGGTLSWTYSDPAGSPETAYQVQITNTGSFNNPVYDSGKVNSSSTALSIPNGVLQFNVTYKARVMVWNSYGVASDWSTSNSWKTPTYAYPDVQPPYQLTYSPSAPSQGSPVQFTDHTLFGGGNSNSRAWSWNFGDGSNSSSQSPAHTYTNVGNYTITETVTDAANQTCSYSRSLSIQKPIPKIKEVAPK